MMIMEKRHFNELKLQVLTLLKNREGLTSHDIHSFMGGERTNICDCLGRLNRQKLVDRSPLPRESIPGRSKYAYTLTERGQNRLSYLKSKKEMVV